MKKIRLIGSVAAVVLVVAAQTARASIDLADLVSTGSTLTVDDKTFSGFSYSESGLTDFNPSQIFVTATESGGVDYINWSGSIQLSSAGAAGADLLLQYIVTANPGPITMIDQAYTGSALNGFLAVDETASIGDFGGTIVGSSHLSALVPSNPPDYNIDVLNIVPPQTALYVTKDIAFSTLSGGGFVTISEVSQSFHQAVAVPEPTTLISGALLLLPLGASTLRILRKKIAA